MGLKYGVILLDDDELIIRIYTENALGQWKLLRYQNFDISAFRIDTILSATHIIEIIAEASLSRAASLVSDWRICIRNVSGLIITDISSATGIPAELLTIGREQELEEIKKILKKS